MFPEHGPAILQAAADALHGTAARADEAAFLKSYARFSRRLGSPPDVRWLAREQVGTDGRRPWSRLAERLFVTGTTYAVGSRDGAAWIVNPAGEILAAQLIRLRFRHISGPASLVTLTHADAAHYAGLTDILASPRPPLWTLDLVAGAVASPGYHRAPRLLPQAVDVDRTAADGEALTWCEYALTFHHFPVPTRFGSAIETTIDGKRALFTGDAFLHPQHEEGCGGWSGLNGALPQDYADCARKVLALKPDFILASRGGPFEFEPGDWERRIRWAEETGKACDRLSRSGDHRLDWDPQAVRVEPFVSTAVAGDAVSIELVARNRTEKPRRLQVVIDGRGRLSSETRVIEVAPGDTARALLSPRVAVDAAKGRHAFPLRVYENGVETDDDAAFVVDVR